MYITEHFTLSELTTTSTGLPNTPGPAELAALKRLCVEALEPIRDVVGPLRVTSGYRSRAVNDAIRGSRTSAHMRGLAADVQPVSMLLDEAFAAALRKMAGGLPLDQLIYYVRPPGKGWLHVGISVGAARREILVNLPGGTCESWSSYRGPMYS